MKSTCRGLAEWAIIYTIGLGSAFFLFVFAMAAVMMLPPPSAGIAGTSVFFLWLFGIVYATRQIVRSEAILKAHISLAPIHALQFVLVLFTIPQFLFGAERNSELLAVLLLTWEVFAALFILSFLLLGSLARKRIPIRTWLYAAFTLTTVAVSVYVGNRS